MERVLVGGGAGGCNLGDVERCVVKASWRLPCGHLPGWGFGCFGYQCGAGQERVVPQSARGGGGCGVGKQERGAGVPWVFLLWCGTRGAAGARVAFA